LSRVLGTSLNISRILQRTIDFPCSSYTKKYMKNFYLLLDTSSFRSVIAFGSKRGVLVNRYLDNLFIYNKCFFSIVNDNMRSLTISFKDIVAVAISGGPGLFTSTKMGMAYARGVSYALSIPLLKLDSLELLVISSPSFVFSCISTIILTISKKEYFVQQFIVWNNKILFYKEQVLFREQISAFLSRYQFIITWDYFIYLQNRDNCIYIRGPLSLSMLKLALSNNIKKKYSLGKFDFHYYNLSLGSYL